jgi:dCMP deaminase
MSSQRKWDKRYLKLAKTIAQWSKDPSTRCGAVIVNSDNEIVSIGFNGFPRNVDDNEDRLNNRYVKYKFMVHAERNALLFARQSLKGCTIYTYPMQACSECAAMIIQSGIKRHVSHHNDNERWAESFAFANQMFKEADVEINFYDSL